ncbi:MAG: hypothetical protein ABIG95_06690 [Candidatus Woesearchaeota archaeon]
MLRTLSNLVHGRRKVSTESLSLNDTKLLLEGLGETRVNIWFGKGTVFTYVSYEATQKPWIDAMSMIREHFPTRRNAYTEATHQVYAGRGYEAHYLDLRHGFSEHIGVTEFRDSPYRRATIDWLVDQD